MIDDLAAFPETLRAPIARLPEETLRVRGEMRLARVAEMMGEHDASHGGEMETMLRVFA